MEINHYLFLQMYAVLIMQDKFVSERKLFCLLNYWHQSASIGINRHQSASIGINYRQPEPKTIAFIFS